jgi:hypothetical protein
MPTIRSRWWLLPSFDTNVTNYEVMSKEQSKSTRRGILEAEAAANNIPNPETMTTTLK